MAEVRRTRLVFSLSLVYPEPSAVVDCCEGQKKIFHIFQSGLQGGSAVVDEGRKKLLKPLVVEETPMSAHTSMKKFLITAAAVAMSTVGLAACSNDSAATPTKSSETSSEKSSEKSSEGSSDKMSSEKATSESTSGDKMSGDSDKMGGDKMGGDSDKMGGDKMTGDSDKMGGDKMEHDKMGGEGDKMEHDDKMSQ